MSVYAVRVEIAQHFRTLLKGVEIFEHAGSFSPEDLNRVSAKAPACVVACLGIPKLNIVGGEPVADVDYGIFVVTSNTIREKRDVAALNLAEKILRSLPFQHWDSKARSRPENISGSNMYSAALDKKGISMWSILWQQQVEILGTVDTDALLTVNTKINSTAVSTPTVPDAEDTITLTGAT